MRNDLRFALRMIFSHRSFSLAIVATVALGIGLNTMVFTLINAVLFKPVPVPGGARLVSINSRNVTTSQQFLPMSYPDFQDYRVQATLRSPIICSAQPLASSPCCTRTLSSAEALSQAINSRAVTPSS